MDIKITDKLYLRSDRYCCWIVEIKTAQKGKNKGKQYEDIFGYYRNPSDAFKALLGHEIRTEDAECLKQLLDAVTAHNDFIEAWVTDTKEVQK